MKTLLYTRVSTAELSTEDKFRLKVSEALEKYCAERQFEMAGTHTENEEVK